MNASQVDIVVVGGGIGGSGLAALLAAGGLSVTVLERTTVFPDRVRGEMYVPWGVAIAEELGLLEPLLEAGAQFTTDWVWYDAAFPPEVAEQLGVHVPDQVPGARGILNFTHPAACQALSDHAVRHGRRLRRQRVLQRGRDVQPERGRRRRARLRRRVGSLRRRRDV